MSTKQSFIFGEMVFGSVWLPYHSDSFATTKHLILLPLWNQTKGRLFRFALFFCCFSLLLHLLLLGFFLCSLSLFLQLELKVLQVATGALVLWICSANVVITQNYIKQY